MKIAMLARNPKLYSHQRLKEAAEARGHEFDILNTTRCNVNIASHRPTVTYDGKTLTGYDAVIPRIGASITNYGLAVLRQFEMQGVWPLNESVAIGRSRDKLRSMQILSKHGNTQPHDEKRGCDHTVLRAALAVLFLQGGARMAITPHDIDDDKDKQQNPDPPRANTRQRKAPQKQRSAQRNHRIAAPRPGEQNWRNQSRSPEDKQRVGKI